MDSSGNNKNLLVLGVCGGIGSGKSQACRLLVDELNCIEHIDADKLAHSVYEPSSPAIKEIIQAFEGQSKSPLVEESTGLLNRTALGQIVFADPAQMATLEKIVWPHVKNRLAELIQAIQQEQATKESSNNKKAVVVVEAALLLEASWEDLLDAVWVVRADQTVALTRLVDQRDMAESDATSRMQAQQSRRGLGDNIKDELERGVVTRVIDNNGSLEDLVETLRTALKDEFGIEA